MKSIYLFVVVLLGLLSSCGDAGFNTDENSAPYDSDAIRDPNKIPTGPDDDGYEPGQQFPEGESPEGVKLTTSITMYFEDQIKANPGTMFDISACIEGNFKMIKGSKLITVNKDVDLDVTVYNANGNACDHEIQVEQYRNGKLVDTPMVLHTSSQGTQANKKVPLKKNDEIKVSWKSDSKQCRTGGQFISHKYSAADGKRPLPRFDFDKCKGKLFPFN